MASLLTVATSGPGHLVVGHMYIYVVILATHSIRSFGTSRLFSADTTGAGSWVVTTIANKIHSSILNMFLFLVMTIIRIHTSLMAGRQVAGRQAAGHQTWMDPDYYQYQNVWTLISDTKILRMKLFDLFAMVATTHNPAPVVSAKKRQLIPNGCIGCVSKKSYVETAKTVSCGEYKVELANRNPSVGKERDTCSDSARIDGYMFDPWLNGFDPFK